MFPSSHMAMLGVGHLPSPVWLDQDWAGPDPLNTAGSGPPAVSSLSADQTLSIWPTGQKYELPCLEYESLNFIKIRSTY